MCDPTVVHWNMCLWKMHRCDLLSGHQMATCFSQKEVAQEYANRNFLFGVKVRKKTQLYFLQGFYLLKSSKQQLVRIILHSKQHDNCSFLIRDILANDWVGIIETCLINVTERVCFILQNLLRNEETFCTFSEKTESW